MTVDLPNLDVCTVLHESTSVSQRIKSDYLLVNTYTHEETCWLPMSLCFHPAVLGVDQVFFFHFAHYHSEIKQVHQPQSDVFESRPALSLTGCSQSSSSALSAASHPRGVFIYLFLLWADPVLRHRANYALLPCVCLRKIQDARGWCFGGGTGLSGGVWDMPDLGMSASVKGACV